MANDGTSSDGGGSSSSSSGGDSKRRSGNDTRGGQEVEDETLETERRPSVTGRQTPHNDNDDSSGVKHCHPDAVSAPAVAVAWAMLVGCHGWSVGRSSCDRRAILDNIR